MSFALRDRRVRLSSRCSLAAKVVFILFLFVHVGMINADPVSFSLYHQVNVDASLEYKFLDPAGSPVSSVDLQIGNNDLGGFYASFNTTRQVSVALRWTPLLRSGEEAVDENTTYPYVMTITNPSGSALAVYASEEAGTIAGASEFVVNGDYGSGQAFFLNKWLRKTGSNAFDTSKICSMSITIAESENLAVGRYSGTVYFITSGS